MCSSVKIRRGCTASIFIDLQSSRQEIIITSRFYFLIKGNSRIGGLLPHVHRAGYKKAHSHTPFTIISNLNSGTSMLDKIYVYYVY
jgi:hypothetical protein